MKYPKLPEELDKRKKLTGEDLVRIKQLYKLGLTQKEIAKDFGVSQAVIWYHLNPESALRHRQNIVLRARQRWQDDIDYRKHRNEVRNKSRKRIYKVSLVHKKYRREQNKLYKLKRRSSPLT